MAKADPSITSADTVKKVKVRRMLLFAKCSHTDMLMWSLLLTKFSITDYNIDEPLLISPCYGGGSGNSYCPWPADHEARNGYDYGDEGGEISKGGGSLGDLCNHVVR